MESTLLNLDGTALLQDEQSWREWYSLLSPEDKRALASAAEKAPRFSPNPGPQTMAFACQADVLGYGGAAGGG